MKRIVLTFGLIGGAIMSVLMAATVPFEHEHGGRAVMIGYTIMVLGFLLVYFGVRSYRDNVGHGSLTFGRGLTVGLLITAVASLCYVATWQVIYYRFMPDFGEKYSAAVLERERASGASAEQLAAKAEQLQRFQELYRNPFFNVAVTFLEPLPVGLVMSLLSAGLLRRRRSGRQLEAALSS